MFMIKKNVEETDSGKKRLFLAINLPPEVKTGIDRLIRDLETKSRHVRWVRSEGLHLTLHFLGYLDAGEQAKLEQAIAEANHKFGPLEFALDRLGAFPDTHAPRVIFLSCRQLSGGSVFDLVEALRRILARQGIATDKRAWKPHITIGRVRESRRNERLDLARLKTPSVKFQVSSFELMSSELKPEGATYEEETSFKLI